MEKLSYTLVDAPGERDALREQLVGEIVPALEKHGSRSTLVGVADLNERVREAAPSRISPSFEPIAAGVHVWLDSLDDRGPIEAALRSLGGELWGYLVTESIPQKAERSWADGERRPGVQQYGANYKPENVSDEDFYREWQIVHSEMSWKLHPLRQSYVRNAVARRLTDEAPPHRAIVLEHFPSFEVFTDDARYYGSREILKEMFDHLPTFYPFEGSFTGPMSEYAFGPFAA